MEIFKLYPKHQRLFIDIETASVRKELDPNLDPELWDSFEYKNRYNKEERMGEFEDLNKFFQEKAALYPEFGRIICISVGYWSQKKETEGQFILKSFADIDEEKMLREFNKLLNTLAGTQKRDGSGSVDRGRGLDVWTGHSLEFDLPYLLRRCIINRVKPHALLDFSNKKPWEVRMLDLKQIWKSINWSPSSLLNITTALGLPSSKEDIDGSQVSRTFWEAENKEEAIERIKAYCERDVKSVADAIEIMENQLT